MPALCLGINLLDPLSGWLGWWSNIKQSLNRTRYQSWDVLGIFALCASSILTNQLRTCICCICSVSQGLSSKTAQESILRRYMVTGINTPYLIGKVDTRRHRFCVRELQRSQPDIFCRSALRKHHGLVTRHGRISPAMSCLDWCGKQAWIEIMYINDLNDHK